MYVFGVNLPLTEIIFFLIIFFTIALFYFAYHLKKLEKMSREEIGEIQELEKMATEDKELEEGLKEELERLKGVEQEEEKDITKFEQDVGILEESTEALYLKKLVPDVYKLQNYVLWALKKGIPPSAIKENLMEKGWKDKDLINMVVSDMEHYVSYFKHKKGLVLTPDEDKSRNEKKETGNIESTNDKKASVAVEPASKQEDIKKPDEPKALLPKLPPVESVKIEAARTNRHRKAARTPKSSRGSLKRVETEIKKLEKDLKKSKRIKKKTKKQETKSKEDPKSVISLDGKKDYDIAIKIK